MFSKLKAAIGRKVRWCDPDYLTRIIIDSVIGKDQGSECGYGIGCSQPDNQNPYLVVDLDEMKILLMPEGEHGNFDMDLQPIKSWTFEEFTTAVLEWEVIQS